MPALAIRVDDERRSLLGVERAQALIRGPCTLEGHGLSDQLDDRQLGFDVGDDAG